MQSTPPLKEFVFGGLSILVATGVAWLLQPFTAYQTVALLYLLLVVAVGLKLSRGPVLTVAATSVVFWNFFFVPPHYTFYIEKLHDGILFATFFVVALAMGHLTTRLRRSELAERQKERRTAALYELAHQAAFASDINLGLQAAVGLIDSIFSVRAALLLRRPDHTLSDKPHSSSSLVLSDKETSVAAWVFSRCTPAGKFTDTLPQSDAMHLPLRGRTSVMGVLSVAPPADRSFDLTDKDLLEAFAVLIGLILEKDHIVQAFKRAEILEASEQLRRTLLESVSHELKTPLAAVQAGIEALSRQVGGEDLKQRTLAEVQLAVRRLHRVINNLLDMTRIESGVVQPKLDWCDVGELIQEAVDLSGEILGEHHIALHLDPALPMVKLDQALMEQCLCNLILNAASWSPPDTEITLDARLKENQLILSVQDEGQGIPETEIHRIFDTFYRGSKSKPGGTGLGLSIVDGFVRAHGGQVRAANRQPHGAEFVITIPVETLPANVMEELA